MTDGFANVELLSDHRGTVLMFAGWGGDWIGLKRE